MSPYGIWGAIGTRASREPFEGKNVKEISDPLRELTELEKKEMLSKPAQVWTARDGKRKLTARQIDIQNESNLVLMTDESDVKRVPLSQLTSEDAYRAIEQHFAEKTKAQTLLRAHLEEGVKLLDAKKFDEFATRFIPGGNLDPGGMGKLVAMDRGLLLYRLESSIRQLNRPNSPVGFAEDESGDLTVEFQRSVSMFSRLQLKYTQGRWKFALPR